MPILPRVAALLTLVFSAVPYSRAQSSAAVGHPLVDHHAHLQSPTAAMLLNEAGTLHGDEGSPEKEKPYTAKDLISALDAAGIGRATALSEAYLLGSRFAHVSSETNEAKVVDAENDWTLQQVRQYPKRLLGFCSVNPIRPYAMAAIGHCGRIGLRGGLKLHLAASHFNFQDEKQIRQLQDVFREANRRGMPILIHLHPDDEKWNGKRDSQIFLEQVLPLAPDITVQVAHMVGWGGYDRSADDALTTFAEKCAAQAKLCARLYFDISAVIVPPSAAQAAAGSDLRMLYETQKTFPEGAERLAANIRRIGIHRVLFATDWPVMGIKEYVGLMRSGLALTSGEVDEIFRNVAPYFPAGMQ